MSDGEDTASREGRFFSEEAQKVGEHGERVHAFGLEKRTGDMTLLAFRQFGRGGCHGRNKKNRFG